MKVKLLRCRTGETVSLIRGTYFPHERAHLHALRIDDDAKEQATAALDAMGLSMSDAVRLFLKRVVADQAFPLEFKAPNAETSAAMAEAEEIAAKHAKRLVQPSRHGSSGQARG